MLRRVFITLLIVFAYLSDAEVYASDGNCFVGEPLSREELNMLVPAVTYYRSGVTVDSWCKSVGKRVVKKILTYKGETAYLMISPAYGVIAVRLKATGKPSGDPIGHFSENLDDSVPPCGKTRDPTCDTEIVEIPAAENNSREYMVRSHWGCGVVVSKRGHYGREGEYVEFDSLSMNKEKCSESTAEFLRRRALCLADGHRWSNVSQSANATGYCQLMVRDAGKPCTDSSQCEGRCVLEKHGEVVAEPVVGVCANRQFLDCFTPVRNGKVFGRICP